MQFKNRFLMIFTLLLALSTVFVTVSAQEEGASPVSNTTVHLFSDATTVEDAWSTLTRSDTGILATLHTSDLTPGDVVTMWWVIFNDPENCTETCGEDDIFVLDDSGEMVIGENGAELNMAQIDAAQIALLGATGNVISDNGAGHFSAVLSTGDNPNTVFGPALVDPMGAEIHLVLRTHGEMIPEVLDQQIIAFNGGCAAEWPNEPCQDVQFAVHQPQ